MAVAYVHCDFSALNVQSVSMVLELVLRQVVGVLVEILDGVRKELKKDLKNVYIDKRY